MFLVRRASYVIGSLTKMCNQLCWYPRRCSYAIIQTTTNHWILLCSNGLLPQSVSSWNRIKVNEAEASSVLQYQLGQDPLPSLSVTHVLILSICCLIAIAEHVIPTLIVNKIIQFLLMVDCDGVLVRIYHKCSGGQNPAYSSTRSLRILF